MISIVVPVYNAEKYLAACIESVLRQSYSDFELILVDDGSSDRSAAICDHYSSLDKRVRCFHRENSGVGNSRNFGMEQANGEWICFIDSDDEVKPDYLEAFDTGNTQADVVASGIEMVDLSDGSVIRREQFAPAEIDLEHDSKPLIPLLPNGFPFAKAYRRAILLESGLRFPTDISFHEDHVFVFDCYLSSKRIETRAEVTYVYKIDYSNHSLSKRRHPWRNHLAASDYMFDRIFKIKQAFGFADDELRAIYTFAYEPVISAIYGIYDTIGKKSDRLAALRGVINGRRPIGQYYFPSSHRGKLIKTMSRLLPIGLLDVFFLAVNRYQNRKK